MSFSPSQRIRVVYFGAPAYAAPALRALVADDRFDVRLVVTQPDRPAGRGRRLTAPAIKTEAERLDLAVYQPESLRTEDARQPLADVDADLFIVAAYGLIFGSRTLALPRIGCVNLHASLLPAYRGASPVTAGILNGDSETGVTLMRMERGLDTGPVIATATTSVLSTDTTDSLTARLGEIGAQLLPEAAPRFVRGEIIPVPQSQAGASAVRPLVKGDGWLDWTKPAAELERRVRAMWPWPRAWTTLGGEALQIHRATVVSAGSVVFNGEDAPGSLIRRGERLIAICGEDGLSLDVVQLPGGKPMTGWQLTASERFRANPRLGEGLEKPDLPPLIRPVDESGDAAVLPTPLSSS